MYSDLWEEKVERSLGILGGNRLDIYSKVGITWVGLLVLWTGAHGEYSLWLFDSQYLTGA